jgi:hypothetical protein
MLLLTTSKLRREAGGLSSARSPFVAKEQIKERSLEWNSSWRSLVYFSYQIDDAFHYSACDWLSLVLSSLSSSPSAFRSTRLTKLKSSKFPPITEKDLTTAERPLRSLFAKCAAPPLLCHPVSCLKPCHNDDVPAYRKGSTFHQANTLSGSDLSIPWHLCTSHHVIERLFLPEDVEHDEWNGWLRQSNLTRLYLLSLSTRLSLVYCGLALSALPQFLWGSTVLPTISHAVSCLVWTLIWTCCLKDRNEH